MSTPLPITGCMAGLLFSASILCQSPPQQIRVNPQPSPTNLQSSNPRDFFDAFGAAYFAADDGVSGVELWRSNSTPGGTMMVADLRPGAAGGLGDGVRSHQMIAVGGRLFFAARPGDPDQVHLFQTDGTDLGTVPVQGAPLLDLSDGTPAFGALRGKLLFVGQGAGGAELWSSDGTAVGTVKLADLDFDAGQSTNGFVLFQGALYFAASDPNNGQELWRSDGTAEGTGMVADLFSGSLPSDPNTPASGYPIHLIPMGDKLLFFAKGPSSQDHELWATDGTALGTSRVGPSDLYVQASADHHGENPQLRPVAMNGFVYFVAARGSEGAELYRCNGRTVSRVADINPGPVGSHPAELCAMDNFLLFVADDGLHGRELWRSDGTEVGTFMVQDIRPGADNSTPHSSEPRGLLRIGSRQLFFAADDGQSGAELWVSNGHTSGTRMVADLEAGAGSSAPRPLGLSRGRLYFSAETAGAGRELWAFDPGATAKVVGRGCGAAGYVPTISANDPVIGGTITARGDNAEPGAVIVVPALGRLGREAHVLKGCSIYLEEFLLLPPMLLLSNGSWQITAPLQVSPSYAGSQLGFQALVGPTPNWPHWALTPALQLTFTTF